MHPRTERKGGAVPGRDQVRAPPGPGSFLGSSLTRRRTGTQATDRRAGWWGRKSEFTYETHTGAEPGARSRGQVPGASECPT